MTKRPEDSFEGQLSALAKQQAAEMTPTDLLTKKRTHAEFMQLMIKERLEETVKPLLTTVNSKLLGDRGNLTFVENNIGNRKKRSEGVLLQLSSDDPRYWGLESSLKLEWKEKSKHIAGDEDLTDILCTLSSENVFFMSAGRWVSLQMLKTHPKSLKLQAKTDEEEKATIQRYLMETLTELGGFD